MEMVAFRGVETTPIPQMVGLHSEEHLLGVSPGHPRCACVAVYQMERSGNIFHTPSHYEDPHSNVRRTSMEMVAFRGVETTFIPKMGRLD